MQMKLKVLAMTKQLNKLVIKALVVKWDRGDQSKFQIHSAETKQQRLT